MYLVNRNYVFSYVLFLVGLMSISSQEVEMTIEGKILDNVSNISRLISKDTINPPAIENVKVEIKGGDIIGLGVAFPRTLATVRTNEQGTFSASFKMTPGRKRIKVRIFFEDDELVLYRKKGVFLIGPYKVAGGNDWVFNEKMDAVEGKIILNNHYATKYGRLWWMTKNIMGVLNSFSNSDLHFNKKLEIIYPLPYPGITQSFVEPRDGKRKGLVHIAEGDLKNEFIISHEVMHSWAFTHTEGTGIIKDILLDNCISDILDNPLNLVWHAVNCGTHDYYYPEDEMYVPFHEGFAEYAGWKVLKLLGHDKPDGWPVNCLGMVSRNAIRDNFVPDLYPPVSFKGLQNNELGWTYLLANLTEPDPEHWDIDSQLNNDFCGDSISHACNLNVNNLEFEDVLTSMTGSSEIGLNPLSAKSISYDEIMRRLQKVRTDFSDEHRLWYEEILDPDEDNLKTFHRYEWDSFKFYPIHTPKPILETSTKEEFVAFDWEYQAQCYESPYPKVHLGYDIELPALISTENEEVVSRASTCYQRASAIARIIKDFDGNEIENGPVKNIWNMNDSESFIYYKDSNIPVLSIEKNIAIGGFTLRYYDENGIVPWANNDSQVNYYDNFAEVEITFEYTMINGEVERKSYIYKKANVGNDPEPQYFVNQNCIEFLTIELGLIPEIDPLGPRPLDPWILIKYFELVNGVKGEELGHTLLKGSLNESNSFSSSTKAVIQKIRETHGATDRKIRLIDNRYQIKQYLNFQSDIPDYLIDREVLRLEEVLRKSEIDFDKF